jgi:hypothetical protein
MTTRSVGRRYPELTTARSTRCVLSFAIGSYNEPDHELAGSVGRAEPIIGARKRGGKKLPEIQPPEARTVPDRVPA